MNSLDPQLAIATDALRVAVLIGLAALIARSMGRAPARVRSTVWLVALTGALVVPVGSRLIAPVEVPIPGWKPADQPMSTPSASRAPIEWLDAAAVEIPGNAARSEPIEVVTRVSESRGGLAIGSLVAGTWAAGAVLLLLRMAVGLGRIAGVVRRSRPVDDPEWSAVLRRAARRVGCRRRVRLRETNELDVPATTGLARPTVLLPESAATWLPDRREVVLMHELVHVRRLDWAARLVARLVTALHWFDPLAWWAAARLDRDQERACDEEVLRAGVRASSYAAHLLEIARAARPRPLLAVSALELARRTDVEDRIMHVLETRRWRRSMTLIGIPAVLAMGSLVPAIAMVRPTPEAPVVVEASGTSPAPPVVPAPEPPPETPPREVPEAAPAAPPASPELGELVREMERLEERIEVPAREIERVVQDRMKDTLREIEQIEIQLDEERLAELEARVRVEMESLETMELASIQAEIEEVAERISEIELDGSLDLEELRAQIEPHVGRLQELHAQLEPIQGQMSDLHVTLEPIQAEIQAIHAEMQLDHERMESLHADLEPLHAEVERLHESMEPVREELERTAERLDAAITREVESAIRDRMGRVVEEAAPWDEAAQRIVDDSHVRIRDNVLAVDAPAAETRAILRDLMSPYRQVDQRSFDAALEQAVDALCPLERTIAMD